MKKRVHTRGKNMQLRSLRQLLIDELQEVYISEQLLGEAIGRMEQGADAKELKDVFRKHGEQTRQQIQRLETVFETLKDSPRGGHGHTMKALLRESEDRMGDGGAPHTVDASLIIAARRVEHWEIASYSTIYTFAQRLGLSEVADILDQILHEEQATDARLAELAQQADPSNDEPVTETV